MFMFMFIRQQMLNYLLMYMKVGHKAVCRF